MPKSQGQDWPRGRGGDLFHTKLTTGKRGPALTPTPPRAHAQAPCQAEGVGAGRGGETRLPRPPSEPGSPGLGGPLPTHTPHDCLPGQGLPHGSGRRGHSYSKVTQTHPGPIQMHVTQTATHICNLTYTHPHTPTHTWSAGCESGLWGLLLWTNFPAKTSELSCALQRPRRRVPVGTHLESGV